MKVWKVAPLDKQEALNISKEYDIPLIAAIMLQVRGYTESEQITEFLSDEAEFSDPFLMADMEKAVYRINKAINTFEKICVYGDYDADGVTSTALLYSYLDSCSANVTYYIPDRETEGYGMNKSAIDKIAEQGVTLIITVDNGISASAEIEYAATLGIDTVVTDHHTPPEILPNAAAVVNPHRLDDESPFKLLSGVGVAFKLVMALEDEFLDIEDLLDRYSDLAAIGTIGDIVPLCGENRILVKHGINMLEKAQRPGIRAMLEEASILGKKLTAGRVSFTLVPRINACGRMALSEKSVRLFLTEDEDEAGIIATELGDDNRQRQSIEREILSNILDDIKLNPQIKYDRIIVADGEGYHPGVIGIVAARLREIYGKPVIVISKCGDTAKASGRSIKGFSLCDAVFSCAHLLTHYGGHPMAVGLSLKTENIEQFRIEINQYAERIEQQVGLPFSELEIDCKLKPASLSPDIVENLSILEPCGAGNPVPLIGLFGMTLTAITPVGGGKHLRLTLKRDNASVTAMQFSFTLEEFPYKIGDILDLAVTVDVNSYNNKLYLSVVVRDIKFSDMDNTLCLKENRTFEKLMKGEKLNPCELKLLLPVREDFASVYRFIHSQKGWHYGLDVLLKRLADDKINYAKLKVILTAMSELNLISFDCNYNDADVDILKTSGKTDINLAPVIRRLRELEEKV